MIANLKFISKFNAARALAAAALFTVAACSDSSVAGPDSAVKREVLPVGTTSVGTFTWLTPLGSAIPPVAETFDSKAVTRVEICVWSANACSGAPVAAFVAAPNSAAGEDLLTANTGAGRFEATFNLLNTRFTTRKAYRIRALNGSIEVGGLLVDVVRGRWALTRNDGSLAPLVSANTLPVQFHVALPPIKVNEVESSGGVPGDWVELYNTGSVPFDISGFVFKDNDDTHAYVIPAGTFIPAGGYFMLEEAAFGFGIGGDDSARLFGPNGSLVDSYSWTTAALTTWGRCPNGTGAFTTMTTVTKGAANDCTIPNTVKINEIESSGGTPGDWIELYNSGTLAVNISGFVLKDNDDTHAYTVPAGTIIPSGGYLVVEEAALGFGLGSADAARLFNSQGVLRDAYEWDAHASTTYGRCPNGVGAFITMNAVTKGTANACPVPTTIKVNEVESNGGVPGDWVELYNTGDAPLDISGFVFKDNDDTHSYAIPAGTVIAPKGFYVLDEAAFTFGLGADDNARIFDQGGSLVDSYAWTAHASTTYGRCPDGTGAFATQTVVTKGAANNCSVPNSVKFNEVESNGGTPGDWAELFNTGGVPVDISGFVFKDNDDTHSYTIPAGTVVAAGAYYVIEEAAMGFGLGSADAVRLFDKNSVVLDSYSWTAHAATTYGRCPNGTGAFINQTSVTKGAVNDCSVPSVLKINEAESNGGTPGDWVELYNTGASSLNISGYIFRDNDDTHTYLIPAGTVIAAGGYYVLEEAAFGFGLGAAESARLYNAEGSLIDSYSWTAHATTTYGRCPNGTGAFVTMTTTTKGTANDCGGPVVPVIPAWPGTESVSFADVAGALGGNMSGLMYEAGVNGGQDVLWAAKNGVGSIFRLVFDGTNWVPDNTNGWGTGKPTKFMDGTGEPDTEDLTFTNGSASGMYISSERNNSSNGTSRLSILRYDVTGSASQLVATNEWVLTGDIPAVGPNLGLEAITWIPDTYLVANNFFDTGANHAYNPSEYANHGDGLFFVGVEATGMIYVYALNHSTNAFTRITSFASGFAGVMSLQWDRELNQLWAICDDTCQGQAKIFIIDQTAGPNLGRFKLTGTFARPASMDNLNNEGFTFAPLSKCVGGQRPAFWADDSNTGAHAIRKASITCVPFPQ